MQTISFFLPRLQESGLGSQDLSEKPWKLKKNMLESFYIRGKRQHMFFCVNHPMIRFRLFGAEKNFWILVKKTIFSFYPGSGSAWRVLPGSGSAKKMWIRNTVYSQTFRQTKWFNLLKTNVSGTDLLPQERDICAPVRQLSSGMSSDTSGTKIERSIFLPLFIFASF